MVNGRIIVKIKLLLALTSGVKAQVSTHIGCICRAEIPAADCVPLLINAHLKPSIAAAEAID